MRPFDEVRGGARLILKYDAPSNSFKGTVENTTNGVLNRVRIEVHLSSGTELGPTTPTDMAPGTLMAINLPATAAPFTGWTAHAEVGGGGVRAASPAVSTDLMVSTGAAASRAANTGAVVSVGVAVRPSPESDRVRNRRNSKVRKPDHGHIQSMMDP